MAVTCSFCGTTADELPLTWTTATENRRLVYFCDGCSRENLRSMEAKLDSEYW